MLYLTLGLFFVVILVDDPKWKKDIFRSDDLIQIDEAAKAKIEEVDPKDRVPISVALRKSPHKATKKNNPAKEVEKDQPIKKLDKRDREGASKDKPEGAGKKEKAPNKTKFANPPTQAVV